MDKKIQEIRTALAEATPGPWKVYRDKSLGETLIGTSYEHPQLKAPNSIVGHVFSVKGEYVYIRDYDADLIANAPTYISYLLQQIDQVGEIRESLDVLKQQMIEIRNYTAKLKKQIEIKDKALEFYADEKNYMANVLASWGPTIPVDEDNGRRARVALKGEDTSE